MATERIHRHRKSRLGCERCKARKVKCDEVHPQCGACSRHGLECVYAPQRPQSSRTNAPNPRVNATIPALLDDSPVSNSNPDYPTSSSSGVAYTAFEMRMLHFFVARTAEVLSASVNLWKVRTPLVAFERPEVLDVLIAVATLHVIRHRQHGNRPYNVSSWGQFFGDDSFFEGQDVGHLRTTSEQYFQRGVQAHRIAVSASNTLKDYEGLFVGSVLIAIYSLFMLGDIETASVGYDEIMWFKLSVGMREIGGSWMDAARRHVISELGVDDDEPNNMDNEELTNSRNGEVLRPLLDFGRAYEVINENENETYEQALIYVGRMYHQVYSRAESSRATCRRLFAMPSRMPPAFRNLVHEQRPRALALLLIAFAIGKLVEDDLVLLKGVARNQIPAIHGRLPTAWKEFLRWPSDVLNADTTVSENWPPIYLGSA